MLSTHPNFPIHIWCQLLPQADLKLKLLQKSRINPILSSHAHLYGEFNYNATPFTPPGAKVIVHKKPSIQNSWSPRGLYGWYINRTKYHYHCYDIYILQTRDVIHADTINFFSTVLKLLSDIPQKIPPLTLWNSSMRSNIRNQPRLLRILKKWRRWNNWQKISNATSSTRRRHHKCRWKHHCAKNPFPTTHGLGWRNPSVQIQGYPPLRLSGCLP